VQETLQLKLAPALLLVAEGPPALTMDLVRVPALALTRMACFVGSGQSLD
jgi:hypothetical protein